VRTVALPTKGQAAYIQHHVDRLRAPEDLARQVQVLDLFSGCGGMSCGFANANTTNLEYVLLGGLDIDRHANATFERNLCRPAIHANASALLEETCLQNALGTWSYDAATPLILIGCAPCQGFSSHRKKDQRIDTRNNLIKTFADIAVILNPDVIIMENVPEIFHSKHWRNYLYFKDKVQSQGYSIRARIHNVAGFGVPQERYRALVIASKKKSRLHFPEASLTPSSYRTVRDAIGHLPLLNAGEVAEDDPMHLTSKHRPETISLLKAIPKDGGSRSSLPKELVKECHKSVDGFRDVYGRLWWDRPSVSITARCRTPSCGRFTHPEQDRGLSVREAALLQGFPSDWHFEGPFDDKYKQIGNAVPPLFAQAIAESIDIYWESKSDPTDQEVSRDISNPLSRSISSSLASWKNRARILDLDNTQCA